MKAQQKQADEKAAASGAGGSSSSNRALGALSGSTPAAPAAVQDLGTVGRGKSRITLQPISSISPSPPPLPVIIASAAPSLSSVSHAVADLDKVTVPVAESPLESKAESPLGSRAESPLGSKRSLTDRMAGGGNHQGNGEGMIGSSAGGGVGEAHLSGLEVNQDTAKRVRFLEEAAVGEVVQIEALDQ